ncbi:hypothetical protein Pecwa_4261 [Pectobacterium parmentieri WPP163]|nr:hypothetical protein Pecwa_4261 [Pectobacterium parmentieri WPP163]AYH07690.1 hypothetical protein C5E25_21190 [Pectobacterium parmentieri]AYH16443.1 hypothetical protein C5E23_20790 [Pectobacterium parmentieri]AYH25143.1 hypothetical protein C5E21_20820 [Pectobacterium parmentieri]MBN3177266.1 hypothetical protein [Pectobacterium parmentieri]
MIRFFLLLLCMSFANYVNAEGLKMAGAFRVFSIGDERISDVLNGEGYDHYHPSGSNLYKTGFEVILPDDITKKGYLVIRSAKTQNTLYRGIYTDKESIIFDADYRLLDEEGLDFLRIEYFDFDKKLLYACEQQKAFRLWVAGSISTITILSAKKPDEEVDGFTYCYEANIYKKINK